MRQCIDSCLDGRCVAHGICRLHIQVHRIAINEDFIGGDHKRGCVHGRYDATWVAVEKVAERKSKAMGHSLWPMEKGNTMP